MAVNNERFVKAKRFTTDFDLEDSTDQVRLKASAVVAAVETGIGADAGAQEAISDAIGFSSYRGPLPSAKSFGIKGDGIVLNAAVSIISGAAALTVVGASFVNGDIGKLIHVPGAGASGAPLNTTIISVISATVVTLGANASTTLLASVQRVAYGTDDTSAINAALALQVGSIGFPAGVYIVSDQCVLQDHSGIVGAGSHFKRRTGYFYRRQSSTVFKYVGTGGTNSCVIRASNKAVGAVGTDFNSTDGITDDLLDYVAKGFHVDSSNVAEYGFYSYRAGNCSSQGDITAERAKKANIVHLGMYEADFGYFGAYEGEDQGVIVGWDVFGWSSVEATNFAFRAKYHLCNNGTAQTFVEDSATDQESAGGRFSIGRGSEVDITSESNFGRAAILSQYNIGSGAGGPTVFNTRYIEGNGAGCYVRYRDGFDGLMIRGGFIHPGNGGALSPQNFKVEGQNNAGSVVTDSGPNDPGAWLVFEGLHGDLSGVGFSINSNTYKYVVRGSARDIVYPASRPRHDDYVATPAQAGAHAYFIADASPNTLNNFNCSVTNTGTGTFLVTFGRDFASGTVPTLLAVVSLSAALNTQVRPTSISSGSATIRTYNSAGALANTGDRISVVAFGTLA